MVSGSGFCPNRLRWTARVGCCPPESSPGWHLFSSRCPDRRNLFCMVAAPRPIQFESHAKSTSSGLRSGFASLRYSWSILVHHFATWVVPSRLALYANWTCPTLRRRTLICREHARRAPALLLPSKIGLGGLSGVPSALRAAVPRSGRLHREFGVCQGRFARFWLRGWVSDACAAKILGASLVGSRLRDRARILQS